MRNLFSRGNSQRTAAAFTVAYALASGLMTAAASAPADQPVPLHGNTVAGLAPTDRVADEDPTRMIDIQLGLQLRNRAELEQLIQRVSTPSSPEYGHYLTPAQFDAQFGPSAAQVNQATGFLRGNGLQVTSAVAGSTIVDARGTVAQVEAALHTSIGHFHDHAGHDFFANDTEPALPASLAAFVTGIQGLNNRYQQHHAAVLPRACPPTCATTPYTPTQIQKAYQLSAAPLTNLTGTGQTLGLLELDDFLQANINGFTSSYALPAITPNRQLVDGGVATGAGQIEVELDIEVMHEIAPAASIQVFEAPNNDPGLIDAYGCMVNPAGNAACPNHGSGLISYTNSTSWGLCEALQLTSTTNAMASIFSQAATQGQSFFAASGDTGSDDCGNSTTLNPSKSVDSPASDLHMTGVGGTRLLLNTDNTYNSETAWPTSSGHPTWGSGGGYSTLNARPVWQTGPGVDVSTGAKRQVPDISLDADPVTGYSIYTCTSSPPCTSGGGLRSIGGTSAGAPAWAAFTAIYNQYAACQGQPKLGFANPVLYPFGVTPPTLTPFTDITTGDNVAGNPAGGYSAGAGYDMVTGLGTLRASDLAQDLPAGAAKPPQLTTVAPSSGSTAGGTAVTLTGCGFVSGAIVNIDGSPTATSVVFVSSTTITANMPAHAAGSATVTVVNPDAQTSNSRPYTYVALPTVTLVNPASGTTTGGTGVTITGTGFNGGTGSGDVTSIDFGGSVLNPASFTVIADGTITVAGTPAHGAGAVDVRVTTHSGTSLTSTSGCPSSPCDRFTFVAPQPAVTQVAPVDGPTAGGTAVTITGSGFIGATAVHFGTVSAPVFSVVDASHITVTSPPASGGTPGAVDVVVTTAGGDSPVATGGCPGSTPCDHFTYIAAPTVTLVTPNSGPDWGNTAVTIQGTNFTGFGGTGPVTSVQFGGVNAASFSVTDATHISAHSASVRPAGAVNVTVISSGGMSAINTGGCPVSPCDRFAYIATPQIVAAVGSDNTPYFQQDLGGFTSLGGGLIAAPAVVSVPSQTGGVGSPIYIGVGGDHNLYVRTATHGWRPLDDTPVYCIDNPGATVLGSTLTIACQGADHGLYRVQGTVLAQDTPPLFSTVNWQALGGGLTAGPAVAFVPGRGLEIMVVGSSNNVYEWYAGTFHADGFMCSGHTALETNPGQTLTYFACHALDNSLLWAQNNGGGWFGAASLGGGILDGPAIALGPQGPTFYVEGTDHHLYHRGIATAYQDDGGYLQFGTAAAALF